MGSIDRRIANLERRFSEPTEQGRSEASTHLKAILNEFAYLKQSCAVRWTGTKKNIPLDGENIPRKILGPGYTHAALERLAVTRSVESGKVPAERTEAYIQFLRESGNREGPGPDEVVEWERGGNVS